MFYIHCDNKGCGKQQAAKLDKETDEVICDECHKLIKNVSPFMKTQLRSFGQVVKDTKKQQAFSVKCIKCKQEGQPLVVIVNNKKELICTYCKNQFGNELTQPFKNTILEFLKVSVDG